MSKSYSYYNGQENKWVPNSDCLYNDLIEKLRDVFGVEKFENGGLMESEVRDLLTNFLEHRDRLPFCTILR